MPNSDFVRIKSMFFDSENVMRQVDAKKRKLLMRVGASIRLRARRSIRSAKKPAPPGQPPHSHAGQLKMIFFGYDADSQSVVVGPIALGGNATVPELMEEGGTIQVPAPAPRGRGAHTPEQAAAYKLLLASGKLPPPAAAKVMVTKKYAPHPFMKPAGDAAAATFADQLKSL